MSRDTFHYTGLLKAPSNLAVNASREGTSTTALDNLFQCLTTLIVKNFFLISSLNLPPFSLKPFTGKFKARYRKAAIRSPQGLLFSRLNNSSSLSLSSQQRCSSLLIVFVTLLWTHSNPLHVLLVLGAPELGAVLLAGSHQRGAEEQNPPPLLLAMLFLMQPWIWLAFWTVSAHCPVMLSLNGICFFFSLFPLSLVLSTCTTEKNLLLSSLLLPKSVS